MSLKQSFYKISSEPADFAVGNLQQNLHNLDFVADIVFLMEFNEEYPKQIREVYTT